MGFYRKSHRKILSHFRTTAWEIPKGIGSSIEVTEEIVKDGIPN